MTNAFYNHTSPFTPGSTIRSDEANAKFDGVATGLDAVEVETKRSVKLPVGADIEITENAVTRANKVLGFDVDGNVVIQPGVGTYKNSWTTSTVYVLRDIVKDAGTAIGLNNLYICSTAHTSSALATDSANWDLLVDVAAVNVLKDQATASAAAALASEGLADADATQTALDKIATNADVVTTNADVVTTNADAASTAADLLLTNADVVTTNADASSTAADLVQTNLDQIQTTSDAASTAADLVQTNLDQIQTTSDAASTAADLVQTNLDQIQTTADVISTNADVVTVVGIYDQFDDRYLGSKADDPILDNDGNTLLVGAEYWNSGSSVRKTWNGSAWVVSGASVAAGIINTPAGDITATNQQAVNNELDSKKAGIALANTFTAPQVFSLGKNTLSATLVDDSATSIDLSTIGATTIGVITIATNAAGIRGLARFRAGVTPSINGIPDATSLVGIAVNNVALGGLTGINGEFTIGAHTDGKLYFENRTGSTVFIVVDLSVGVGA